VLSFSSRKTRKGNHPENDIKKIKILKVHKEGGKHSTVLCVNSEMESSKQYGNIFIKNNQESGIVEHYVEKPENCVTSTISCGIYAFSRSIFDVLKVIFNTTFQNNVHVFRRFTSRHPLTGRFPSSATFSRLFALPKSFSACFPIPLLSKSNLLPLPFPPHHYSFLG
jgi:hypothetical protein